MRTSVRLDPKWVTLALILVVSTLQACTIAKPVVDFPKPEKPVLPSESAYQHLSPSSQQVAAAVENVVRLYEKELLPHLAALSAIKCQGCAEMREPVKNSLRGSYILYVALLQTEYAVRTSNPQTDKESRIAAAGEALIREIENIVADTIRSLQYAYAYLRANDEWLLSQLTEPNKKIFEQTAEIIRSKEQRVRAATAKYLESIGS